MKVKNILVITLIVSILVVSFVGAIIKIDDIKDDKYYDFKLKDIYKDKAILSQTVCWEYKDNDTTKKCLNERTYNFVYENNFRLEHSCSVIPVIKSDCDYLSSDEKICYLDGEEHNCIFKWYKTESDYEKIKEKFK